MIVNAQKHGIVHERVGRQFARQPREDGNVEFDFAQLVNARDQRGFGDGGRGRGLGNEKERERGYKRKAYAYGVNRWKSRYE